jgi:antitoxin component YwqK of YwqJK toxin-antitoxin module
VSESDIKIDHDGSGVCAPEGYTGLWEVYWPNFQRKFRANYVDGKEVGEVTCWWSNGNLSQTGYSDQGICRGVWTDYLDDGTKFKETDYADDKNFIERWFSDDEVDRVIEFRNGIEFKDTEFQQGVAILIRWYSDDGIVTRLEQFRNGIKVKETEYRDERNYTVRWYSGGKIIRIDEWRDGQILEQE